MTCNVDICPRMVDIPRYGEGVTMLNRVERWLIRRWLDGKRKEGKVWQLIWYALSFVAKNVALVVGIVEAVVKAIGGIISLTPTKRDDAFLPRIDDFFSAIKAALYSLSDLMGGQDPDTRP